MDANKVQDCIREEMKMDVSLGSDNERNHNHNHNQSLDYVNDTEDESAMEQNYWHQAKQRKRKLCSDYEECLL